MVLTTYADDVRVTSITTEPVHTWSRVMANCAALDTLLDEMAQTQNTAKQEHSVFFAGQRARQFSAALNGKGVLPGSTGPVARYLGPHLDIMGSIRPELERRRAAAFRTWTRFRPVWLRAGTPLRVRRLFFQALVVSILKTDLESLRLRSPDYERCSPNLQARLQTPTWHCHSDQHVCMVSQLLQRSMSDLSSSSTVMETRILCGEG